MEIDVNESATHHPNRFLADLTQAMRLTAESARQSNVDQCRADAQAYIEQLRARSASAAGELGKASDIDISAIRDQSKARVEAVRVETEQRVARRRELLDQEMQEYNAAVELEIQRVDQRVEAFKSELATFFEQLLEGADPAALASMAANMPDPPTFAEADREALAERIRASREESAANRAGDSASGSAAGKEELPDHWWMDSPAKLASRTRDEKAE
jgi:hypothetical protein